MILCYVDLMCNCTAAPDTITTTHCVAHAAKTMTELGKRANRGRRGGMRAPREAHAAPPSRAAGAPRSCTSESAVPGDAQSPWRRFRFVPRSPSELGWSANLVCCFPAKNLRSGTPDPNPKFSRFKRILGIDDHREILHRKVNCSTRTPKSSSSVNAIGSPHVRASYPFVGRTARTVSCWTDFAMQQL